MKKLLTFISLILISTSCFSINPEHKDNQLRSVQFEIHKDSLSIDQQTTSQLKHYHDERQLKLFKFWNGLALSTGVISFLGIVLAIAGGLSLTTATFIGLYAFIFAFPLSLLAVIFGVILRHRVPLTKRQKKIWLASLIVNGLSVAVIAIILSL